MVKRIATITLIIAVIMSLILPLLNLKAAEATTTEPVKSIGDLLNELVTLKDNGDLSKTKKAAQEIEVRKEALIKILAFSNNELSDLQHKLESLDLDATHNDIRTNFLDLIGTYNDYHSFLQEAIAHAATLNEIKEVARTYKTWRDHNYAPVVQTIMNFIIIVNEKSLLVTANSRLEKIIADITKL